MEPFLPPVDLAPIRSHSLLERTGSLVRAEWLAETPGPDASFRDFWRSLPRILGAQRLRDLVAEIRRARTAGRPIGVAIGGHVAKTGTTPLLIDLIRRGYVHLVAMHGATAIHDFELALAGHTSEDVKARLETGDFGMSREAPDFFRRAAERATAQGIGLGTAMGLLILQESLPNREISVLAQAAASRIPVTVHVAFGTDTVFMHPTLPPALLGEASHLDFRILTRFVSDLDGGVWLNVGSAVILPEVFLKAFAAARNLGNPLRDVVTANLDMTRHYRPQVNVLDRPAARSYEIVGHHEIVLPLLRMGLIVDEEGETATGG